jgi:hypothetical protein
MAGRRKKVCGKCMIAFHHAEEKCPKCGSADLRSFIRTVDGLQRGRRQDIPGQLPLPLVKREGDALFFQEDEFRGRK